MIRFKENYTAQVIENFDEESEVIQDTEVTFKAGEIIDANIFNEPEKDKADIQYAVGSVSYGVPKDVFEEM